MKNLLIMRHAKSSWKEDNIPDHERPLKKRGLKDAAEIGKILKNKELVPDKIISSNAVRAADTAAVVAEKCGFKKDVDFTDKLYMAEGSTIMDLIHKQPDSVKSLLIIGHNPGMEALVQVFSKKVESLATANVACFQADIKSWKELTMDSKIKLKKFWQPSAD
jgi:phosphohistidine phosphatase